MPRCFDHIELKVGPDSSAYGFCLITADEMGLLSTFLPRSNIYCIEYIQMKIAPFQIESALATQPTTEYVPQFSSV